MRNKIKKIREEKGITQEQLAEKAGISRTALSLIENNRTDPDGVTIAKLVKILKIPANDIFFDLNVV